MNKIRVSAYERSRPERKPDPFKEIIEANRGALIGRYPTIPKKERSRLQRVLIRLGRIWGK